MAGRLIQFQPENGNNVAASKYTVLFNKQSIGTVKPSSNGVLLFDAAFSLSLQDLKWVIEKVLAFFNKQSKSQVT